nr:reverse transcriptase domain-containing protein [Tanacetum cinerariifolium]
MEEDYKPSVQHQRQDNLKIHDIIKKEVEKLLDAGLIYPISDSPWVSPIHCVPKKGGFTMVENEENELIPNRLVTRWRTASLGTFKFPLTPVIKKRQLSPAHMALLPTVASFWLVQCSGHFSKVYVSHFSRHGQFWYAWAPPQVTQFGSTALTGAGVVDRVGAGDWFFLSKSNALTMSLSSTTSDEMAGVDELVPTFATTALARV